MHRPKIRSSRLTRSTGMSTVRATFVALCLVSGGLATQFVASGVAHAADTPQICDTMSHVKIGDLSGSWTNAGEEVQLTHVGSSVTGIAFYTEGGSASYTGCFDGHTFYLAYNNAVDDGYGQLTLSADGNTLSGYWVSNEDNAGQHSWTLTRYNPYQPFRGTPRVM